MAGIPEDREMDRSSMFSAILIWLLMFSLANLFNNQFKENDITYNSYPISIIKSQNNHRRRWIISNNHCNALMFSTQFGNERNCSLKFKLLSKRDMQNGAKHQTSHNPKAFHDVSDVHHTFNETNMFKCHSLGNVCRKKSGEQCSDARFKQMISDIHFLAVAVTLLYNLYQRSNIASFDIEEKGLKGKSYRFVFKFWYKPKLRTDVYHFSLKKYINEIERESDKSNKHMVHEWARLESFQAFPEQCPVSTVRLAQTGFYSTGKSVEVVCFCCGLRNEYWTEEESASELHKRLSPNCKFINGEKTENVPIHDYSKINRANTEGACGGPNDTQENQRSSHKKHKKQISQRSESKNETGQTPNANTHLHNQVNTTLGNGTVDRISNNHITDEIRYFPGIPNQRPKHPEYATKSERFSSFSSWSARNVMKPETLTEAGYFFTGIQDLVRCFFCGGGMKSWEYGDSPWIEHARWFPTCAFLKLCKGQDFVTLCQMSGMTFLTQDNFQLREIDSRQTIIVDDRQITDLNSIAAKRVFDMGYSQPQIEEATMHVRQNIGQSEIIKAQDLLEYLLDNCYQTSDDTSQNASATENEQSNTLNDEREEVSSSQNNSARSTTTKESSPGGYGNKEERQSLKEENRVLKEQIMCKICLDKDANTVFLPCGHLVACVECAHALRKCAVCRKVIQGTVRAYPA